MAQPAHAGPESASGKAHADHACVTATFKDMKLSDDLLKGLHEIGYDKPTPVQQQAIPSALSRRNVVVQAPLSSGRTLALLIAALQIVDTSSSAIQAVLLAPSRESAAHLVARLAALADYTSVGCLKLRGGAHELATQSALREGGLQVIVATPGRLLDCMRRGLLSLDAVRLLGINEVGQCMQRGFSDDMAAIRAGAPSATVFVTSQPGDCDDATLARLSRDVLNLSTTSTPSSLVTINIPANSDALRMYVLDVADVSGTPDSRLDALCDLYERCTIGQAAIHCATRRTADTLALALQERDVTGVSIMRDDTEALEAEALLEGFAKGEVRVLLTSDVVAAQADTVAGVTVGAGPLVVNYDVPADVTVLRSRLARFCVAPSHMVCVCLATAAELPRLQGLAQKMGVPLQPLPQDFASLL